MNSPIRFTGLTSGMDTQAMVTQLMRAESMRMDRFTRRRQVLQWRQETIRASMTRMNEFRAERTTFDRPGAINNERTWNVNNATLENAGGGTTNGITVRALEPNARQGAFDIQVRQVAQGDLVMGEELDSRFAVNLDASVAEFAVFHNMSHTAPDETHRNVLINGRNIRFYDTDTLQQFMDRVNNSEAGVNLYFDVERNRFFIESATTGANAVVSTGEDNLGLLEAMGLANIRPGTANLGATHGTGILRPTLNLGSALSDFVVDLSGVSSVTIAGRAIAVNADDELGEFLDRARDVLQGDPSDPSDNTGVRLLFHGGRFTLHGYDGSTEISVGDGNPNALLEFMFGAGNYDFTVENRAHTDGMSMPFRDGFDISTLSGSATLGATFGFTGSATFVVGDQDDVLNRITVTDSTTLNEFRDALNANAAGAEFDFDNGSFTLHAAPGELIPDFGLLQPLAPGEPGYDTINPNIENAQRILNGLFGDNFGAMSIQMGIISANHLPAFREHTPTIPSALDGEVGAAQDISITVSGTTHTIAVAADAPWQSVMDRINEIDGISMTFNAGTGAFRLAATGNQSDANFLATGLEFMGFGSSVELQAYDSDRLLRSAQNAILIYDHGGVKPSVVREQDSNNFDIHGLRITLSAGVETARNVGGVYTGGVFSINNERDIDSAVEAIEEFIEAFNTLLRYVNLQHSTARPRAGGRATGAFFEPLTDEQRAAMSDREVERWEEQARTGLLHRDGDMRNLHNQLRRAMFEPIDLGGGRRLALHEIGITTVGREGAPGEQMIGLLQITEQGMATLRAALEENPEDVQALFARNPVQASDIHDNMEYRNRGTIAQRNNRFNVVGLGFRLDDLLNTFAQDDRGPLQQRAGYHSGMNVSDNHLSRQISDYNRRIDAMQIWLNRRENHFFSMFARMEAAMAQSHSQMDALFAFAMQ